eukprot:6797817-Pyramimonas_sp.AAC.2
MTLSKRWGSGSSLHHFVSQRLKVRRFGSVRKLQKRVSGRASFPGGKSDDPYMLTAQERTNPVRLCPNIRSHQSYTRTTSCTCSNLGLIRHLMAIPTVKSIGHIPSEKLSDLHCRWKKVSKQDVPESDTMCDIFSGVDVQISTHDHLASLPKIYGGMSDYTPGKLKVKAPKQTPLKEIPEKYIQPGCGMKFGGEK